MTFEIDTIVAPATPAGRSALAVIRVSGPKSRAVVGAMADRVLKDREPSLCLLKNRAGQLLDEALVTYFQAPRSYTGEDLVEISCHGNPSIVETITKEIVSRGTRLALAGEFTQRALANEKLGLDQVEGLDWVLNSKTIEGARIGLRAKLGAVGASVEELRADLIEVLSCLEASLDFSDEELGGSQGPNIDSKLQGLESSLQRWVKAFDLNQIYLRNQLVVLAGNPNSGKSSLFNALIGQNKAIVFDTPGTTRDLVEQEILIGGKGITLVDTAGFRPEPDPIEGLGIERSRQAIQRADLVLWVCEHGSFSDPELAALLQDKTTIRVQSKIDLRVDAGANSSANHKVSVVSGAGLDNLMAAILPMGGPEDEFGVLTSKRQRDLADEARGLIERSHELFRSGAPLDQVVAEVNGCKMKIEEITGRVSANDVLSSIFARFCIGK